MCSFGLGVFFLWGQTFQLYACKGRGPGYSWALSLSSPKILKKVENFEKWLVETQNKILSRIAILSYTSSVQVGRQKCLRIFRIFGDKHVHNFLSCLQILLRVVSNGDTICIFMHAKREVWENSVARDWLGPRFLFFCAGSRKLLSLEYFRVIVISHMIVSNLFKEFR